MSSRPTDATFDDEAAPTTVESLLREIDSVGRPDADAGTDDEDDVAAAIAAAVDVLGGDEAFTFDESLVKTDLEPLLVALVALRERGTHGKALMTALAHQFDARLSPGTVYPSLHDLADEELLRVLEMVRTKEYRVDDAELTRELLAETMCQHLALGFFFREALGRTA